MGEILSIEQLIKEENRFKKLASKIRKTMDLVVRRVVKLTEEDKEKYFCSEMKKLLPEKYLRDGLRLLEYGKSGCPLFLAGEKVIKLINPEKSEEFDYLKKVNNANSDGLNNIVGLSDFSARFGVMCLEYVRGTRLDVLMKNNALPMSTVWKYGRGICNGILELRRAGIYHRDLHDRNIIISLEDKVQFNINESNETTIIKRFYDQPVIIDLGAATYDSDNEHDGNTAYGGNNDLISLGQIMYRMAIGTNMFK